MLHRIRGQFGSRVADIVEACSDTLAVPGQPKEPWRERKEAYIAHLKVADADSLLVSACDKLHNARAIVADLREIGNDLWKRFSTKNGADQIWYYQTVCDVFAKRIRPGLGSALQDAVVEMTAPANPSSVATDQQRDWAVAHRRDATTAFPDQFGSDNDGSRGVAHHTAATNGRRVDR